jgi:lipopolysaccharide transport system permease protein
MDLSFFINVWAYRGFVFSSVKRDFLVRYKGSMLGAVWAVLSPLAMITVYTVIFSKIMQAKLPGVESTFGYSIYLCAGILTWGFFSEMILGMQSLFIQNAQLLKKMNFPRTCLPIITLLNALVNFGIIFGLFSVFLLLSGNFPGWVYFALLPVFAVLVLFSLGLGIWLGVLNVFFRDVSHLAGIVLQFWFWLTPIVYPASILPDSVRLRAGLNPMAGLIGAFQKILTEHALPDWSGLWPAAALAVVLCVSGWCLFRKRSGEMVDEL